MYLYLFIENYGCNIKKAIKSEVTPKVWTKNFWGHFIWTHLYFWLLELLFLHKSTAEEELNTEAEGESVLEEAILHIYATT